MLLSSILFLMKVNIEIIHQCMIDYHLWKSIYHIFLFVASYRYIEEEILRSSELIVFGPLYDGRQHKIWSIWYPNDMRLCPPHIKCLRTFQVLISNVYAKGNSRISKHNNTRSNSDSTMGKKAMLLNIFPVLNLVCQFDY